MKIFGVGLSKTGTTSLTRALDVLGYKTIHNPSYMIELKDGVLTLDFNEVNLYDALTDIQIARFYKDLDEKFPGSKFILTTRAIDRWLESCRNHFNIHAKRAEKVRALDRAMYGSDVFDINGFRQAYYKHCEDVVNYFADRKSDLLVMDVSDENKWEKLCGFLDIPVPDEEYPTKNKSMQIPIPVKNFFRRSPFVWGLVKSVRRMREKK